MSNEFLEASIFAEELICASVLNKYGWYERTLEQLHNRELLLAHVKCLQQHEAPLCRATGFEPFECTLAGKSSSFATAHEAAAVLLLHLLKIVELHRVPVDADNAERREAANRAYELGEDVQRVLKRMRIERSMLLGNDATAMPAAVTKFPMRDQETDTTTEGDHPVAASTADTLPDTVKKIKKYPMTTEARLCAEAFKQLVDSGDRQALHDFVAAWIEERSQTQGTSLSASTLEKRLRQNRDEWDPDGKYKHIRLPQ